MNDIIFIVGTVGAILIPSFIAGFMVFKLLTWHNNRVVEKRINKAVDDGLHDAFCDLSSTTTTASIPVDCIYTGDGKLTFFDTDMRNLHIARDILMGESGPSVAERYGLGKTTVYDITHQVCWDFLRGYHYDGDYPHTIRDFKRKPWKGLLLDHINSQVFKG